MQLLHQKNKDWKYLLTLAGQMFPLKTNLDIVRILKAMNGSNAVMAINKKWVTGTDISINVSLGFDKIGVIQ